MPRLNVDVETKVAFFKFKREFETELNLDNDLNQNEFLAILCKHKVQILDVIVELELATSKAKKEKVAA
jgi:hypothetical protein